MTLSETDEEFDACLPRELQVTTLATSASVVRSYAELTGDFNPLHLDAEFSARTPFGQPIVHGTVALSLLVQSIENTFGTIVTDLDIRFKAPATVGMTLHAGGERLPEPDRTYAVYVVDDDHRRLIEGTLTLLPQPLKHSSDTTDFQE